MQRFLNSDFPPCRLIAWCHVGGHLRPQLITKKIIDFFDMTVACSPYTYECNAIQSLPENTREERTDMVYGPTDFENFNGITPMPHNGFNVGYIGTVDYTKMHKRFIEMCKMIQIDDAKFIVCGGNMGGHLPWKAKQLGIGEKMDFRQYVDPGSVLCELDVYGYPLCEDTYAASELNIQEAMFAGVPVVAFPYGGIKRLITDHQTGLLVNTEKEYAEAIEYLYHNPVERKRIGSNAAQYAQQVFGAENAAPNMKKVYDKVLSIPKLKRKWSLGGDAVRYAPGEMDPPQEEDLVSGSDYFIESLGDQGEEFKLSKMSVDISEIFEAEKEIACLSDLMQRTVRNSYGNYYNNDPYFRLWTALFLMRHGNYMEAAMHLAKSIEFGLGHWRVLWYLCQACDAMGEKAYAKKLAEKIVQESPQFNEAREYLNGATGNS